MITSPAGVANRRVRALTGITAALVALTLAACGSSGGGTKPTTQQDSASVAAPASTAGAATTGTGASASPAAGPADPATAGAITKAYVTFFNSKTAQAGSQANLQHGDKFAAAIAAQAKNPAAAGLSATVSKVVLTSPSLATVTFTLLTSGKAVLTNTPGYAVQENGTWKVAAGTFCALLSLQGTPPAACNDASLTALPS